MAQEFVTMAYAGVRYPVSSDTAKFVIDKIESFRVVTWSDFIEVPTTDGRQVALRVGQSFPIAFETETDRE